MNVAKTLTFVASLLIATAGIAGIRAYANASANSVLPTAVGAQIQTLPAITVHPTPEQMKQLRHVRNTDNHDYESASLGGSDIGMPYYSFAASPVANER